MGKDHYTVGTGTVGTASQGDLTLKKVTKTLGATPSSLAFRNGFLYVMFQGGANQIGAYAVQADGARSTVQEPSRTARSWARVRGDWPMESLVMFGLSGSAGSGRVRARPLSRSHSRRRRGA